MCDGLSRLVVVGDVRVPRIGGRFERVGAAGRLVIEVDPATPHRVTREGRAVLIRFDADLLDVAPFTGLANDFVASTRVDGLTIRIDPGSAVATANTSDDRDQVNVTVDLLPPAPVAPPPPPPPPPAPVARPTTAPPPQDAAPAPVAPPPLSTMHTVVIDPGHGGDDEGAKGAAGSKEKDVVLQVARRLKAAIEARWGLHVLLTREGDENVPIDQRTALANNNKADLFISLHANESSRPAVRGAQVLTLGLDDYKDPSRQFVARNAPVPVLGGGMRALDPVPWDVAQIPFIASSSQLAEALVKHLGERQVPLYSPGHTEGPMRVLVGANMPAVLLEMGFLTNKDDELALVGVDVPGAIVEALLAMIADQRAGVGATHEPSDHPGPLPAPPPTRQPSLNHD